ncbi:unnamed protein product, partial [Prorocentrum cordatum]
EELLLAVGEQPRADPRPRQAAPPLGGGAASRAVYFAPSQWRGRCAWLYEAEGLWDPELFRRAARRLVDRHEGLRFTLVDPPELLVFASVPAGLQVALWPFLREHLGRCSWPGWAVRAAGWLSAAACKAVAFGLKGGWPRVGPAAGPGGGAEEPAVRCVRCASWEEVKRGMQAQGREYVPPFALGLYLLEAEGGGPAKSFLHIVCTHAFSDGFTCFPLIADLAELYEAEVAALAGERCDPAPPLPCAFGVLERRLFEALELQPFDVAPEQVSMRCTEFYVPLCPSIKEPGQYNHHVQFDAGAVALLRQCGRSYAAPLDVVLLSCVTTALLRAGVSDAAGRLTGFPRVADHPRQLLSLALYAPMRDGAHQEAMVGLFSDWRELKVASAPGDGATVLGELVRLVQQIRGRRWGKFDAMQNSQRVLVNILALDERPRGACALRQTRAHEWWPDKDEGRTRQYRSSALRPMRLTLEQYELTTWWLSLDLAEDSFPPHWCRMFVANLERTVGELVNAPFTPVV